MHCPGNKLYIANALSRALQKDVTIKVDFLEEDTGPVKVCGLILGEAHRTHLVTDTEKDPVLGKLKSYCCWFSRS